MSANTIESSTFREVQYMRQWWVITLVAGIAALGWFGFVYQVILGYPFGDRPAPDWVLWLLWIGAGWVAPVSLAIFHLTTEVCDDHLYVHWFPFVRKHIAYDDIDDCAAVTYQPIWNYGGWGVRWSPWRGWVYSMSGDRGVHLVLRGGKRLLIGSQHADELAQAVNERRRGLVL
jgi:hypothetical protein